MGMSSGSSKSKVALSEINVTPLVDVMLVLLIIFMVTAPMMQQGIEVNLPETAASGVPTTEEPFVLSISASGRIKAGNASIDIEQLRSKLMAIFSTRSSKEVYIQADKKTDYGTVAEVMAEIRSAGIYNISLITLPKARL
jgi:biopolymer transport protein TolR